MANWMEMYDALTNCGIPVYLPGQHTGICKESYAVVCDGETNPEKNGTILRKNYSVKLYVPLDQYTLQSALIDRITDALESLFSQIRFTGKIKQTGIDADLKAHCCEMVYQSTIIGGTSDIDEPGDVVIDEVARVEVVANGHCSALLSCGGASILPAFSKGKNHELRIDDEIIALDKAADIIIGYDIKLKNALISSDTMATAFGWGILDRSPDRDAIAGQSCGSMPATGEYTLRVYTVERDKNGNVDGYVQYTFERCMAVPGEAQLHRALLFSSLFLVHSRPNPGETIVSVTYLPALPATDKEVKN